MAWPFTNAQGKRMLSHGSEGIPTIIIDFHGRIGIKI
jgi:hypothetical protein